MQTRLKEVPVLKAQASRPFTREQIARYESYLAEILQALGMPVDADGTRETPARLLKAWIDSTAGYESDPKLLTLFPAPRAEGEKGVHSQVVEGPIPFVALCEHHALPFFGHAWVGYVPDECVIGLSKLTRLVRQFSRRFTMQERIGSEVAAALEGLLCARGAAVRLEAAHLCTRMRGVRETESVTRSIAWRGCYEEAESLRREFLALATRGA